MRVCPACKTENPSKAKFCSHCGKMLVDKEDLSVEEKLELELQKAREENELLKMTLKNSLQKEDEQDEMEDAAGDAGSVAEEEVLAQEIANDTVAAVEAEPAVEAPAESAPSEERVRVDSEPRPRQSKTVALVIVLLVIVGGAIFFILDYYASGNDKKEETADTSWTVEEVTGKTGEGDVYYVYATHVMLRSDANANSGNGNVIAKPSYGSAVRIPDKSVRSDGKHVFYYVYYDTDGKTYGGYVAKDYLMSKEDFLFLDGIFGDENARNLIGRGANRKGCGEARYKRAILNYFKNTLRENANEWKIYCRDPASATNNVFHGKATFPSQEVEFAVIIKNVNTNERRLLCFDFDENENVSSINELDAANYGFLESVYWIREGGCSGVCPEYDYN